MIRPIALLATMGLLAGRASAQAPPAPSPPRVLVLPFTTLGEGGPMATMLRNVLSAEIAGQGYGIAVDLREADLKLGVATADARDRCEDDGCLADVGRKIGLSFLVLGGVSKIGDEHRLVVRMVDVGRRATVRGPFSTTVTGSETEAVRAMRNAARLLFETGGAVLVSCEIAGAEILLDGSRVGTTPLREPLKVAEGKHSLMVRKPGFVEFLQVVEVQPGGRHRIPVRLKPLARRNPAAPPERAPPRPIYRRPLFWGAVGAVAATVVVGTVVATSREPETVVKETPTNTTFEW